MASSASFFFGVATTPGGTLPPATGFAAGTYDPVGRRLARRHLAALTLGGTPIWTPLSPPSPHPDRRYGHSAIYDQVRDRMVIFGGWYEPPFGGPAQTATTWALSLSGPLQWQQLPSGPGSPRADHVAIYDRLRDRMVMYGGDYRAGLNDYALSDTWALVWGTQHPNPTIDVIPAVADRGRPRISEQLADPVA